VNEEEIIYVNPSEGFEYMSMAARLRTARLGIYEIAASRGADLDDRLRSAVPDAMRVIGEGVEMYQAFGVFGDEESKRKLSTWIIAIFNDAAVAAVDEFHRTIIRESN
jgi:hypothetical protein